MDFFNPGTGKCDFLAPSFSMTCSHQKWRYIPQPHTGRRKTPFFNDLLIGLLWHGLLAFDESKLLFFTVQF